MTNNQAQSHRPVVDNKLNNHFPNQTDFPTQNPDQSVTSILK